MCALYALLNHFMTEYAFVIDDSPNMYILRQRTSIFLVPKWSPASQTIVWFTFNFSLLSKNIFTIAKGNKYTVQAHGQWRTPGTQQDNWENRKEPNCVANKNRRKEEKKKGSKQECFTELPFPSYTRLHPLQQLLN